MNTIKLTALKCVDPEDWGSDGDEPSLKIIIDGGKPFRVRVAKHIQKGETIPLDYEYRFKRYIQVEVWDMDEGTWYDKHDFINKFRVTSYDTPGEWFYTLSGSGAKYEVSYHLETPISQSNDQSQEHLDPLAVRKKILKHFAESPEISPRIWKYYSRDQVALEMQARFCRQGMSREEIARLSSYPYAGVTYSFSFPMQGRTELCGPAAIAYDLMLADPTSYMSSIAALYEAGECPVGGLYLRPRKKLKRSFRKRISAIDWMFLGSMRDGRNKFYDVDKDAGPLALFTPPKDMLYWLRKIYPNERIRQRLSFFGWDSDKAHRRAISEALRKTTRSFLLIDTKLIKRGLGGNRISRLHWIVIRPGTAVWSEGGNRVSFTYFTWGMETEGSFRVKDLIKYLYVTIVRE